MENKKKIAENLANDANKSQIQLPPLDVIVANLGFWLENAIIAARLLNEEARKKASQENAKDALSKSE